MGVVFIKKSNRLSVPYSYPIRMPQIDLPDADVQYLSSFLKKEQADAYLEELLSSLAWEQKPIFLFGRQLMQPRLVAWYGDPGISYTYSGLRLQALPWTPKLLQIKETVEGETSHSYNSVLCNLYRDGKDSMGWHSDDEPELGKEPCIASLSLGEERSFHLKHRTRKEVPSTKILLAHGSLLVMKGATQSQYKHQLPKSRKKLSPRINLTFRLIR